MKNDHCCFLSKRVAPFNRPRPQEIRQAHRRRRQGRWGRKLYPLGRSGSRYRWRSRGSVHWCLRTPCPWAHYLCRV